MKRVLLFFSLCFTAGSLLSQTAEDSVKTTINTLFEGMKNSDTLLLRSVFADSAILQTIARTKEGKTSVRTDGVSGFVESVGKLQKGSADERISYDVVKIDGALAIAWTPYKFYFNGKLNHCGVNSFQLVRLDGKWKIQYLIDTRRREGCE
jgi:hypothetical protein